MQYSVPYSRASCQRKTRGKLQAQPWGIKNRDEDQGHDLKVLLAYKSCPWVEEQRDGAEDSILIPRELSLGSEEGSKVKLREAWASLLQWRITSCVYDAQCPVPCPGHLYPVGKLSSSLKILMSETTFPSSAPIDLFEPIFVA